MGLTTLKLVAIALLLRLAVANATAARVVHNDTIASRLKVEEDDEEGAGWSPCWESVFQLRACTAEVVLFFLNGETYLGAGCCQAIRTIERDCWPDLLTALGYTSEEGDILYEYCDAPHSPDSGSDLPPLPPVSA